MYDLKDNKILFSYAVVTTMADERGDRLKSKKSNTNGVEWSWKNLISLNRLNEHVAKVIKARFIRRISVASNAIQTIDNETDYLIICCLNCIRRFGNSTGSIGEALLSSEGSFWA